MELRGRLVKHTNLVGDLVTSQVLGEVPAQFGQVRLRLSRHNCRGHPLTEPLIGYAVDSGVNHIGMIEQNLLDFGGAKRWPRLSGSDQSYGR